MVDPLCVISSSQQPVVEVNVAKNRVQPANALQAKYFVSRVMMGANWWQSPFSAPARPLPGGIKSVAEPPDLYLPFFFDPAWVLPLPSPLLGAGQDLVEQNVHFAPYLPAR